MIEVEVYRSATGLFQGFGVRGHADFAPPGEDIVCAAVSALTLAAAMGLVKVAGKAVAGEQKEGRLECRLEEVGDEKSEMILATMLLGLEEIQRQYPQCVRISNRRI